jgi:glycosyltransferase involved in cell wall biosynthesis
MRFVVAMTNLCHTGGRTVGLGLLEGLCSVDAAHELTILHPADDEYRSAVAALGAESVPIGAAGGLRASRWTIDQQLIPRLVREREADALLTLNSLGAWRPGCAHVVMIQFPFLAYPLRELEFHLDLRQRVGVWLRDFWFRRMQANVDALIVQTPVMKRRMETRWGFAPSSVHVVPPGISLPEVSDDAPPLLAALQGRPRSYVAYNASPTPHKNLEILPDVLAALRARGVDLDLALTVADDAPGMPSVLDRARRLGVRDRLLCLGRITHADSIALLRRAECLVMPTLLETFGLPYGEAMACGCPVTTSDRDFARTTCGEAAIYFDPLDAGSIAGAVLKARETGMRSRLITAGKGVVEQLFSGGASWEPAAAACLRVLEAAASRRRSAVRPAPVEPGYGMANVPVLGPLPEHPRQRTTGSPKA